MLFTMIGLSLRTAMICEWYDALGRRIWPNRDGQLAANCKPLGYPSASG
jgi:hypothetical protein